MSKAKTGRLTVTIHEVRKLFNTQSMGAQDPYAKIECGDVKYKTKVVKDAGSMCSFEQQFLFDLKGGELFVVIELWAEKALGDDFIGKCVVPIIQFFAKKVEPTWTRLGRNAKDNVAIAAAGAAGAAAAGAAANPFAGEVLISSEFVDDDKSADAKEQATAAAIAQLNAQLLYYQAALGQKFRDADAEAKAYEAKVAELTQKNAEQKEQMAKMEAIIAGLRAAASANAVVAADAKSAAGGQVAALEKQIEALRPPPVVEEYYENQRYAPIVGWKAPFMPYDPKPFTNAQMQERTRNQIALPQGWVWTTEWTIDCTSHPVEHVSGWEYALEFSSALHTAWHPHNTASDTVRRRRWVRTREVQLFAGAKPNAAVAAAAVAAGALPAGAK